MTDRSRRSFLRSAVVGGAVAGGAAVLPRGLALAAAGGDPVYRLTVVNNSADFVDLCVYQAPPDLGVQNVMALAWFVEPAYPTTTVQFTWNTDYSFVWGQPGLLSPGAPFQSSQIWPADPFDVNNNQVVLDYGNGAFTFVHGTTAGTPQVGNLYIRETGNIPLNGAGVGIGMSGAGTFAVAAQPNQNLVFTPHPQYWITAGTYQAGRAIDVQQITNAAQLPFPPGVFALTAVLNSDNTWTVNPTSSS